MQAVLLAVLQASLQALLCFLLLGALPRLGNALGARGAAAAAHGAMPVRAGLAGAGRRWASSAPCHAASALNQMRPPQARRC